MTLQLGDDAVVLGGEALHLDGERRREGGDERPEEALAHRVAAAEDTGVGRRPDHRVDDVGSEEVEEALPVAPREPFVGTADALLAVVERRHAISITVPASPQPQGAGSIRAPRPLA